MINMIILVYREYQPLFRKWARASSSTDRESGANRAYCCHWMSTPQAFNIVFTFQRNEVDGKVVQGFYIYLVVEQ